MSHSDPALHRIRELYRRLPVIDCQRRCAHSCVPVAMSRAEAVNLGIPASAPTTAARNPLGVPRCSRLTKQGDCGDHADRPMICRLWGVTGSMRCPYGCAPTDGRYLTDADAMELLVHSLALGGHDLLDDPGVAERMEQMIRWGDLPALVLRYVRGDATAVVPLRRALDDFARHHASRTSQA